METRIYNRLALSQFIHSKQFDKLKAIPISRHRAISQINNPRSKHDDVLLAVQFDDERMIGYLGVLPDCVFYKQEIKMVGWLSCFWVDEAYRSQSVAAGLFLSIMEAWDNQILITNFVPTLTPLYKKTGLFSSELIKTGIRAYMRSNLAEILPPKNKLLKSMRPVLSFMDFLDNLIGDIRFYFFKPYKPNGYHISYTGEIDETLGKYIQEHNQNNWNRRGKDELNWILKYPWVIEASKPDHDSSRYYFTSVDRRFKCQILKVTAKNDKISALAMICIRSNNLTVPYIFCEVAQYEMISMILVNIMVELKLNMITVFQDQLAQAVTRCKGPFLLKKKIIKPYLITKKLEFINKLSFQDGDGDCAFY